MRRVFGESAEKEGGMFWMVVSKSCCLLFYFNYFFLCSTETTIWMVTFLARKVCGWKQGPNAARLTNCFIFRVLVNTQLNPVLCKREKVFRNSKAVCPRAGELWPINVSRLISWITTTDRPTFWEQTPIYHNKAESLPDYRRDNGKMWLVLRNLRVEKPSPLARCLLHTGS